MGSAPIDDDFDYDDGLHDCYECGGEGFVSNCVEEWACLDPDYGCDYCTRRCPLCNSPKRDASLHPALAEALAASGTEARSDETEGLGPQGDGPARDSGDTQPPSPPPPQHPRD